MKSLDHIDGNPRNNDPSNLRMVETVSEQLNRLTRTVSLDLFRADMKRMDETSRMFAGWRHQEYLQALCGPWGRARS